MRGDTVHRLVVLTTDFGLQDHYVGVMKGVLLGICRDLSLIDLCHEVPPQDVRSGAFLLLCSYRYFPPGTVQLAVVDPGVGTERRPIAVQAGPYFFVGPDNGLFSYVLQDMVREGRIEGHCEGDLFFPGDGCRAFHLDRPERWLKPVSGTFHGRDVFAPVAAQIASGWRLEDLGSPVQSIVALRWPMPEERSPGKVVGQVVHVDRFGNLVTNLRLGDLPDGEVEFAIAGVRIAGLRRTYGEAAAGEVIALEGSCGFIEIAVPNGNAAARLRVGSGSPVVAKAVELYNGR